MQSSKVGVCLAHPEEGRAEGIVADEVREKTGCVSAPLDESSSALVVSWSLTLHYMGNQPLVVTPTSHSVETLYSNHMLPCVLIVPLSPAELLL